MFRREWLTARYRVVADGAYVLPDGRTVRLDALLRFATVDLAASTKTTADYSVILSAGRVHDGGTYRASRAPRVVSS